jgi:hypothetical protein
MPTLSRFALRTMKQRGVETRIVIAAGYSPPRSADQTLLKAVAGARSWSDQLASVQARSLAEITRKEVSPTALLSVSPAAPLSHPP